MVEQIYALARPQLAIVRRDAAFEWRDPVSGAPHRGLAWAVLETPGPAGPTVDCQRHGGDHNRDRQWHRKDQDE